ncbi:hypothetical protein ES703_102813 [subsurface metagenome]
MSDWLIKLFIYIMPLVSPALLKRLQEFAKQFREDARKTENGADDIIADILCWILRVE